MFSLNFHRTSRVTIYRKLQNVSTKGTNYSAVTQLSGIHCGPSHHFKLQKGHDFSCMPDPRIGSHK
jgi:hypothetical protein